MRKVKGKVKTYQTHGLAQQVDDRLVGHGAGVR